MLHHVSPHRRGAALRSIRNNFIDGLTLAPKLRSFFAYDVNIIGSAVGCGLSSDVRQS